MHTNPIGSSRSHMTIEWVVQMKVCTQIRSVLTSCLGVFESLKVSSDYMTKGSHFVEYFSSV